tara:strand:+ start:46 stop:666 length:621 start_codon:yes stop_codon:yes gene_type:complete
MNEPYNILFGNGEVPIHTSALKILKKAKTIICLDGGVDKLLDLGYSPNYILGDLDSLSLHPDNYDCDVIELHDQSKNDLDKGLEWCLKNNISKIILIGFSGQRDDQNMAALYSLRSFSEKLDLTMITNHSTIHCIKGQSKVNVANGQIISLMASNSMTSITTRGLKHELDNDRLLSPGHGISNIALTDSIEIQADDWIWVFLNHIT